MAGELDDGGFGKFALLIMIAVVYILYQWQKVHKQRKEEGKELISNASAIYWFFALFACHGVASLVTLMIFGDFSVFIYIPMFLITMFFAKKLRNKWL